MDKNTGLVSFAQNKIASLRKICVNLRIAAGLFTNSSVIETFENMSKSLIFSADAQEFVICGCAANRIGNFFPSSEIGITITNLCTSAEKMSDFDMFSKYASQDEFVKSPAAIRKFTQNLRKLAILFCAKDTSPVVKSKQI